MPWTGRKKLALYPLYRPHAKPPDEIPSDWANEIMQRMVYDPEPPTGSDRSLRAYIQTVSSGLADLDAVVMPMQTVDEQDVPVDVLEAQFGAQLRQQGFDAAAIVMLGEPGAGSAMRGGFWARFVMLEDVGTWAMEFMHCLTNFDDLYPFGGTIGHFDEMNCACGTHPTAYTKAAVQWLSRSAITQYNGQNVTYALHTVGLVQPPPSNRWTAIQIGTTVPYLMIEARTRVDQFDINIPSEGVIVYRIQTTDPYGTAQNSLSPIVLLTPTALAAGQSYTTDAGVVIQVTAAIAGGFTVSLTNPNAPVAVPNVFEMGVTAATAAIQKAGLVPVFTGPNQKLSWVRTQTPVAGAMAAKGSKVTMTLSTAPEP
jgi:hypothetical protein